MSSSATWSSSPAPSRVRPPRRQRMGTLGIGSLGGSTTTYFIVGLVIGLVIGLPILGWWLWPVHTSNAVPADLAPAYSEAYVAMAADSYALSGDLALAKARLSSWSDEDLVRIFASLQEEAAASGSTIQVARLGQLAADLGLSTSGAVSQEGTGASGTEGAAARVSTGGRSGAKPLLIIGVLLLACGLVLGGYLVQRQGGREKLSSAIRSLRSHKITVPRPDLSHLHRETVRVTRPEGTPASVQGAAPRAGEAAQAAEDDDDEASLEDVLSLLAQDIDIDERDEAAPSPSQAEVAPRPRPAEVEDADAIGVFMATYRHGSDEMFDTSYYLGYPDGEFLGECGVGVAETVGDASPEQACAMEIWLFDKGDIRTTTKLLVTDFALDDPDVRDMLAGRGDLVRASRGQTLHLETAGLRLQANVIDVQYGDAPNSPPRSFFQELTLELRVHRKS